MTAATSILLTLLTFFIVAVTHPRRVPCLPGFHAEALHDGVFECARPYGCVDHRGPRGGWTSTCEGEDRYAAAIECPATIAWNGGGVVCR